jgi:hypothetical protein
VNPDSIVDMLEPLRAPAPLSWWPPAPGWWVLAVLALALLLLAGRALWRFHRRGAPLRAAKAALKDLQDGTLSDSETAAALGILQRRLAIRIAGRERCAGLTGEAWADFLNSLSPKGQRYFDATLAELSYRPDIDARDCADALEATQSWLRDLERPA